MSDHRWSLADMPDQTGHTAIITGANSGTGYEAAAALAARGARVVLGCRSVERGEAAAASIRARASDAVLEVEQLDLASLTSVRQFAAKVAKRHDRIDMLLNNAGIMAVPEGRSVDGVELQFASNHLGHFLLTGLLMPQLAAATAGRVVSMSSLAAKIGKLVLEDVSAPMRYNSWQAYYSSKLANLLFVRELQRRLSLSGSSVIACSAHPGIASTNLMNTPGKSMARVLGWLLQGFFQPAAQAALPLLFAATSPDAAPGAYYGPGGSGERKGLPAPAKLPPQARDESMAKELWALSERLGNIAYPRLP